MSGRFRVTDQSELGQASQYKRVRTSPKEEPTTSALHLST
jgi:hypothetical protein